MASIKPTFNRAASGKIFGVEFWMILAVLAMTDDADRRESEQREKRENAAKPRPKRKPHAGPRPF
jgi:hypothetical protein